MFVTKQLMVPNDFQSIFFHILQTGLEQLESE